MNKSKELTAVKFSASAQIRRLAGGLIYLLCGFVISGAEFPMMTHPLGAALMVSACKSSRRLKWYSDFSFYMLCVGCAASTLLYGKNGVLYFTMYCALFLIRFALTGGKFNEARVVKMALSLTSSLCIGFVGCAINGMGLWEILGILVLSVCAPVFACLFDGVTDAETSPVHFEAACGALMFSLLFGIKSVHIFSFSLPVILSGFAALYVAKKRGALYGALAGMVCGLAGENFILPPVLGIMGFAAGMFFEQSEIFALLIAYTGAISYGIYCMGFDAVGYLAPEFLVSCVMFFPIKGLIAIAPALPVQNMPEGEEKHAAEQSRTLMKISDAFSSLSDIALENPGDQLPDKSECKYFVRRAFEEACSGCVMKSVCQLNDEILGESLRAKLSEMLCAGSLENSELPAGFADKCRHHSQIISKCLARYRRACVPASPPVRSRMLSGEYNTVSKLLRSTADSISRSTALSDAFKLKRVLDELGIKHKSFEVKGSRRAVIDVTGVCAASIEVSSERIRQQVEKECGFCVSEPEFFTKGGLEVMRMVRCPAITLEYAKASRTKNGEQKNGDCITVFENDNDCFYSLICDGMGSGRDAAAASKTASSFIEKLMTSCSPENITIEMLNNFLISRESECFSTIDLLEVDRLESKASFIKAGAAPSFIIREGKLHKISSNTPPAGVLYSMTAEKTTMKLYKNDIIVMLSDGILENGELAPWLMELFTYDLEGSPDAMANKIISQASSKCTRGDDMSVAVLRIA